MSIYEMKLGQTAVVNTVCGDEKLAKRLLALGCVKGTPVTVKNVAPLGDPIIIHVSGFDLAIRKKDAKNIHISA